MLNHTDVAKAARVGMCVMNFINLFWIYFNFDFFIFSQIWLLWVVSFQFPCRCCPFTFYRFQIFCWWLGHQGWLIPVNQYRHMLCKIRKISSTRVDSWELMLKRTHELFRRWIHHTLDRLVWIQMLIGLQKWIQSLLTSLVHARHRQIPWENIFVGILWNGPNVLWLLKLIFISSFKGFVNFLFFIFAITKQFYGLTWLVFFDAWLSGMHHLKGRRLIIIIKLII